MKTRLEKIAALLSSGLLVLTLTACGAGEDDTTPDSEEPPTQEQFDTFEDEPAPDSQNEEDLQEDTGTETTDAE